jgi:hypothetical protein
MRSLTKTLKEDWPDCFARCAEDVDGCIQVGGCVQLQAVYACMHTGIYAYAYMCLRM